MSGVLYSALGAPTEFDRSGTGGLWVSGIQGMTSGPSPNLGLNFGGTPLAAMGVSKLYTNKKDFNTGFVANRPITNKMGIDTDRYNPGDLYAESLVFSGKGISSTVGHHTTYPLMCLQAVNAFLRSEKGRERFGHDKSYEEIWKTFTFVGQSVGTLAPWQKEAVSGGHEQSIATVVGGHMRIKDYWRAQTTTLGFGKMHPTTSEGDYAYLILQKCRMKNELDEEIAMLRRMRKEEHEKKRKAIRWFDRHSSVGPSSSKRAKSSSAAASSSDDEDEDDDDPKKTERELECERDMEQHPQVYYWQYWVARTSDRRPPKSCLYRNDTGKWDEEDFYIGMCIKLGRVGLVDGDRTFNAELMYAARNALTPSENFKQEDNRLPRIDIWAGVN
jgi:hypothetical protein